MKKEDFFEVLGELDDDIVKGAKSTMKENKNRKPAWVKWGSVAACLCLIAAGAYLLLHQKASIPGAGDEGGAEAEGFYSVAVYPPTESKRNVASAAVTSLTEDEALRDPLAAHLPRELPEGFHYGRGSIYNTVMKDGTEYHMLRIEYISGQIPEQQFAEDGGAIAPDLEIVGDTFTVCVMNYEPNSDRTIYSSNEEITLSLLEQNRNVDFLSGDCIVSVFSNTAEPAMVLDALRSIAG